MNNSIKDNFEKHSNVIKTSLITIWSQLPTLAYLSWVNEGSVWTWVLLSLTWILVSTIVNWVQTIKDNTEIEELKRVLRMVQQDKSWEKYSDSPEYSFFLDKEWTPGLKRVFHRHWQDFLCEARTITDFVLESWLSYSSEFKFDEYLWSKIYIAERRYQHDAFPVENSNWVLWVMHQFKRK